MRRDGLEVDRFNLLRDLFPGKRIVIAEFSWPSAGYNRRDANPGEIAQAEVLRDFVRRAEALGNGRGQSLHLCGVRDIDPAGQHRRAGRQHFGHLLQWDECAGWPDHLHQRPL